MTYTKELVGAIGLEPTTPTMSRWCSNQLSYAPEEVRILAHCDMGSKQVIKANAASRYNSDMSVSIIDSQALQQIADTGYVVIDEFMPQSTVSELVLECQALRRQNLMKQAGISQQKLTHTQIRGDFTYWLQDSSCSKQQQAYLDRMSKLQSLFNQEFFLSLSEFECHLAIYPVGARYQKHLDQFQSATNRKISAVFYLNQNWQAADGGQLRLYLDGENPQPYLDIFPLGGRLVLFDSARFWHEVLPASKERMSITGWFRSGNRAWT